MMQDPREKVRKLCETDVNAALLFARKIESPWNRAQSLANVAWHTLEKDGFLKIVNEALEAARETCQPNRIVSCGAWIIHAVIRRNDVDASPFVKEQLEIIRAEPNPVRRADALLLLFQAVYRHGELRYFVLEPLLQACSEMNSWKQPRILGDIALVTAIDDIPLANKVIEMIGNGRIKRQTLTTIERGGRLGAREFFA